jgi:hypothetical protein
MTTTVTKRVADGGSSSITRRVSIGTHGADYDTWADSWGTSWGEHWHVFFGASEIAAITQRVLSTDIGSTSTKRVTL